MRDVEQRIADWRRRLETAGIQEPALTELENHLREDVAALVASGASGTEAFARAAARIGEPGSLRAEFAKLETPRCMVVTVGGWLLALFMAAFAVFLLRGLIAGRLSWLLLSHIFTLTAGYCALFLAGGFSVYHVGCEAFGNLSSARQHALRSAVCRLNGLAAGLVGLGLVPGICWSIRHLPGSGEGNPRAIGTFAVAVWVITLGLVQHRLDPRTIHLAGIAGNVVISLAWFGAGMMAIGVHASQFEIYWPLVIFLAANALVFAKAATLPRAVLVK